MSERRRKHSAEFKLEAVRLATGGGKAVAEVAQSLGVRADLLYKWLREFAPKKSDGASSLGGAKITSQDEEIRRLRVELRVVREERDVLKKATAFFARASQ